MADKLITPHPLYNALAQVEEMRCAVYKKLFDGRVPEKVVEEFNGSMEKDNALGNEDFHVRIAKLIGRSATKGRHGSDRKSKIFKDQQL